MVTRCKRILNILYKLLENTKIPIYFDSNVHRDGMKNGKVAKTVFHIKC